MELYTYADLRYVKIVRIPKFEVEKVDFDICKQPRETPDAYYKRISGKPEVVVNAGFFSMSNGETIFSVINENNICSGDSNVTKGIGITTEGEVQFGDFKDKNWKDFMSAYPPLIVNGEDYKTELAKEIDYKARRTIFGYNSKYYYIICVDSPGMNFKQLRELCHNLNIQYAVNFDGGGSTRLLVNGKRETENIFARPVDSVLCIYLKHDNVIVNYTIQPSVNLNIRYGPGTNYKITGMLKAKSGIYTVVEQTADGWGKLKSGIGWVYLPYTIKYFKDNKITEKKKYEVLASVLNIRSGPGEKYKIVSVKHKYDIIESEVESKGWVKTKEGWLSQKYLKQRN